MKWNDKCCFVLFVCLISSCGNDDSKLAETKTTSTMENNEGKKLFQTKCASCHMVNKELTGPALKGVEDRWPNKQMLYAFIKNSEAVIATDSYAKTLWQQYNLTIMPPHPDLTDENITNILKYVQAVSE